MLKALLLSLLVSFSTQSFAANPLKGNATNPAKSENQIAYHDLVRSLYEARPTLVAMITQIGLRSDREEAILLFKQANTLLLTLNVTPTNTDLLKLDKIIANFDQISAFYEEHKGRRYVEI